MGRDFIASNVVTGIAAGINKYYFINTGSLTAHMSMLASVFPGCTYSIFEGPTISSNGTAINIFNQNRNASFGSTVSIFVDPTVSIEGTVIYTEQIGSLTQGGKGGASSDSERNEFGLILKPNTKYLLKLSTLATGTSISTSFRWDETV